MRWCLSKPKISQDSCIKWKVNCDFTWDRFDLKNTCKFTVIIAWEEALLDSSSVRWVEKGLHFWMPFLTQSMWLKSSDFKWDHFESLFLTSFVMQKGDSLSFKNKKSSGSVSSGSSNMRPMRSLRLRSKGTWVQSHLFPNDFVLNMRTGR